MKHSIQRWWLFVLLFTSVLAACQNKQTPAPPADALKNKLLIGIIEDGVVQVSLKNLQNAGLALDSLEVQNLALSLAGTAVPYLIQNDSLIFYGQAANGRYSNTRPYILETGQEGLLIPTRNNDQPFASQQTVKQIRHLEENHHYESQAITAEQPDPWFWTEINRAQKVDIPVTISDPGDGSGQLSLQLWGKTYSADVENDHDLELLINGKMIDNIQWDGNVHYLAQMSLPPGSLQVGENIITLSNEAPGAAFLDIMALNWLDLSYTSPATAVADQLTFSTDADAHINLTGFSQEPLLLNIQDPANPQQLTQANFQADMLVTAVGPAGFKQAANLTLMRQNSWRSPENQADLLIITTDELLPALAPLIVAREAEGLSVTTVPIVEIYEEFGFGQQSPEAIQTFMSYAFKNWQTPPRYLLLVGEATTDYRGYANDLPANHIPSPLVPVAYSGETVSDTRLADVDGDKRPDLAVGRWPLDTLAEVEDLVARTLAYEMGTAVNNAIFASDASEDRFGPMAERIWQQGNLADTAVTHLNGAQAAEVTKAWNAGTWLTTYIGHGSLQLWGKDNIFNIEAVDGLQADQAPIVVQLTCLTGLFAQPGTEALAEVMLQHKNGPVLIVAATSLTLSNNQEPFAVHLLQNLNDPAYERLGDAFQNAKQALDIEHNEGLREISDTFILLGDPSARIVRP